MFVQGFLELNAINWIWLVAYLTKPPPPPPPITRRIWTFHENGFEDHSGGGDDRPSLATPLLYTCTNLQNNLYEAMLS